MGKQIEICRGFLRAGGGQKKKGGIYNRNYHSPLKWDDNIWKNIKSKIFKIRELTEYRKNFLEYSNVCSVFEVKLDRKNKGRIRVRQYMAKIKWTPKHYMCGDGDC